MSLNRIFQSIKSDFKSTLILINHLIKNDPSKLNFNFAIASTNSPTIKLKEQWSLENIFDGFLWHAPRSRRSIERRLRRRFGFMNKHAPTVKLLKRKNDLVICDDCGSWHEMANICQVCYLKVKEETRAIQDAIMKNLGLNPVEKEVKIKYQNEDSIQGDNYFVEIPKERPSWFAHNLISNSAHPVKPNKAISVNTELEGKIVDK